MKAIMLLIFPPTDPLITACGGASPQGEAFSAVRCCRRKILLTAAHNYKSLLLWEKVSSRSETDEGNFLSSDFPCVFIPTPSFH